MKAALAALVMSVPGIVVAAPAGAANQAVGSGAAAKGGGDETIGTGVDKVICKREKVSGSRTVAKKVCQTAAEWERQRRADQQAIEKIQSSRTKGN